MIKFVMPTDEHVLNLAENLRRGDREELEASFDGTPYEAIKHSCDRSVLITAAVNENDDVYCIFGLVPFAPLSNTAIIWLLTSEKINNIKVSFVKYSRRVVKEALGHYPILTNWVDMRYTQAIWWAESIGAKFGGTVSVNGHKFVQIFFRRDS